MRLSVDYEFKSLKDLSELQVALSKFPELICNIRGSTLGLARRLIRIRSVLRRHGGLSTKQIFDKVKSGGCVSQRTIFRDLTFLYLHGEVRFEESFNKGRYKKWYLV